MELLEYLKSIGVDYKLTEHREVATIEDMEDIIRDVEGAHYKNLFVRNQKGNEHYLVILEHSREVNLRDLGEKLGSGKLSFCSEKRLKKYLGITPGSVSPFCLINDKNKEVIVVLDKDMMKQEKINFHPNRNTAMLTVTPKGLEKFLWEQEYTFTTY